MDLALKTERDLFGIDTFERAIIFGCLLIRKGLRLAELPTNQVVVYQSFGQSNEGKTTNLTVEVKLPYDSLSFLSLGGDFISSILPFGTGNVTYTGEAIEPTINNQNLIPEEPISVNSLEKYLAWAITEWVKFNKSKGEKTWDSFGYFSFLEEAKPPVLSAKLILPLDYEKFINSKNLIGSVISSSESEENNQSSIIGNNLFGNVFLVGN